MDMVQTITYLIGKCRLKQTVWQQQQRTKKLVINCSKIVPLVNLHKWQTVRPQDQAESDCTQNFLILTPNT